MDSSGAEHYVEELYFLITKFLEAGPCKEAFQKLKEEIAAHKIIPKRLDWEGKEHDQSFEELESKYPHIAPQHLLEICKRIGPILDKEISPCAPGVKTLLGAGSQSLLRNRDTVKKNLRLSEFILRHHGRSIYSPATVLNHNVVQVLYGQEISGPACRRHLFGPKAYHRMRLLNRALGHLTAVYCLLFDQTGKFIITGADDLLVKVWSGVDGRLLCTLRGASAEITDIAINLENTLIAAGSLDKAVRVWSLQAAYPVATLSAHTGMITGVNFCPNPFSGNYYLVSTSTDGSVAFWSYTTNPIIFQKKPVLYNEKIRPGQAQMICSSFSYGGVFLATGSADHHVRVYSMATNPPQRILEMEKHSDRVDSLLWANGGLKFISGSKDGTAVIWCYKAQNWRTTLLDMNTVLPGSTARDDDSRVKLKVTMVCWNCDDSFAITAVNNAVIKIWNTNGKLIRELTSHEDVVYVLEYHPLDPAVLLSAGHDGIIYLWDLRSGELIFKHQNHIEGQGNGAIFDAKWSSDGTMIAATDSHGHLLIFGIGDYSDMMKSLPKELFFHTDYRPLVRDSQNQVLDEQTQTPPHLMPPPFLVDIDGNPYPPQLQRLVPGRESCSVDQLIPHIVYTPGGQPEVVQFTSETRSHIDQRIEELVQQSAAAASSPSINETSPVPRVIRRGDVEGLRQSRGSQDFDLFSWKKRGLIPPLSKGTLETMRTRIKFFGDLEIQEYEKEKNREIELIPELPSVLSRKPKKKLLHNYRTRAARGAQDSQPSRVEDGSEVGMTDGNSSDVTGLSSNSSSESSSSEYSDWVADHSVNLEPPQRSRRQRKRRPPPSASVSLSKSPPPPSESQPSTSTEPLLPMPSTSKKPPLPPLQEIEEIPELYKPSEWLSEVIPKKFPYYPQMGDEVVFFAQGYELYLKAVTDRKVYELAKSQLRPWGNVTLQEPELVKVIGIKYELRPPRLCCLRLAVMKENGSLTGDRFTIKYHDVPDVIDFFVLKQTYDTAMMRNWKIGDRFRSMIDDGWWWGVIEGRRPHSDSAFLCHRIRWDNGETEDMSPWDMEPIDSSREPDAGGSVPVLPKEIAAILYHPRGDEWPGGDRESYCKRLLSGFEQVMELSIAEPFAAPVDINIYKSYAMVVEYPIDLSTIKARLDNRFYRRLTAAQFDIRCIATNAEKFNESHSVIVKNARIITDLCLKICKETDYMDVSVLYRQLVDTYESSNSEDEGPSRREQAAASRSLRAMRRSNQLQQPDWRRDCRQLLEVLWNCQDSEPFRRAVDRLEHPDYHKVVTTPMDLGQIREELQGGNYASPIEFCKDLRVMFSNSRQYNTNKRSKIYVMTVRLQAMAEEHMKGIIKDWKNTNRKKKQNKAKHNGLKRRNRDEESDESSEGESSESPPEEVSSKQAYSQIQSANVPKRIKVLLPKVNESSSSSADLPSSFNNPGPYRTRPRNMTKSTRFDLSNEDSSEPIRPNRLRVPIMKKLNHFVCTSETDTSSQPSTSSGHRSLRAHKAVSYAENGEDSSPDDKPSSSKPYNIRSKGYSKSSFPLGSRVNYKEESGSENDDEKKPRSALQNESESDDDDMEPVPEADGESLEIHINGIENHLSNSSSSSIFRRSRSSGRGGRRGRAIEEEEDEEAIDESVEDSSNSGLKAGRNLPSEGGEEALEEDEDRVISEEEVVDEEEVADDDGSPEAAARGESDESGDDYQLEENEEESDEESFEGSQYRTRQKPGGKERRRPQSSRTTSARKRKKSTESNSSGESFQLRTKSGSQRRSVRTRRPVKRQNYSYESESEGEGQAPSSPASDEDSDSGKPKISISSRGRVRKITPRARAYLLD